MTKIVRLISLIVIICMSYYSAQAQDMSNIRVDELSDKQVQNFLNQVQASGLSDAQLEQVALARGMSSSEVGKLRERVNKLKVSTKKQDNPSAQSRNFPVQTERNFSQDSLFRAQEESKTEAEKALDELKSKIFGASLFKNINPQFEPNLNIATPKNYIIGTGDELMIEIYGYSEASHQLAVSPEGNINIPYVGVVSVAGATIEDASTRIKNKLKSIYSGISNGNTQVNITISNIRSIKVILTGEIVKPGTYTLPSVASVFNALYASGGPTENGTMRDIRIVRNGRVISTLDVYDFLTKGSLDNNITLQDQDVIFVPPYFKRVELIGQVKRPALFEMKDDETFEDLLDFSGGFTEYAYQDRIKVLKNTGKERRIEDLLNSQFNQYRPESGDKFTVSRILERFENRVNINGAVFRPGDYELSPGLTLSMLIKKADGVKEDAYLNLGYISRLKSNLEREQVSFNVANILAGTEPDIVLKREDEIVISSIFDLKNEYTLRIEGEVRNPGRFPFAEGISISELVMQAGGFTESASPLRIEISRRVRNSDSSSHDANIADVYQVDLNRDLTPLEKQINLMPFDLVVVRGAAGYEVQKNVRIEGEVLYPGIYTIKSKNEKIADLIERAGGLTKFAYAKGASLKRGADNADDLVKVEKSESESEKFLETLEKEKENNRATEIQQLEVKPGELADVQLNRSIKNDYVGINLERILQAPEINDNLLLEEGDILYIPKELQTVKISGEVLSPVTSVYQKGRGFKGYISQAGGFTQQALKRRSYVVYANGSAQSTGSFLFFKSYPSVEPGAEIFVPQRMERERLSPQAWIGMGTGVASLAAIIVSLLR